MNPLSKDRPYVFMVGMRPKRKRDKQKPLQAVVIMADSEDLAWGLFRKQEVEGMWDIIELAPTNSDGDNLKRLEFKDRVRKNYVTRQKNRRR